ncbi:2,3-dehydroadipyl-CoA hydratase [Zhongshania aliphaticivorans]|uniref:2,3-dehydroadipyl-CoA hydratase n=1 Tax=Zhongshania aliphaticivorans TaxID=1470434 RepID=A0A5S9Q2B4_9GAMM|nr:enoyl-CoA hydratase [Zhongshania aliphaticivorans]CAA0093416.1 2,3-dehydroadipyl-CoA hydratase [Zhongshania aliphaticivorans]CAA0111326.1 2,3-dehydroadipyl-CoA hydratase [Zhongshania aliphaticivorans]
MSVLLSHTDEGVTTVTLNRPEQLNALSLELRAALAQEFKRLATDQATDVVILTGSGRSFSAGLDLKELGQTGLQSEGDGGPEFHDAVRNLGKPLIGAINGFAITGGFEIALMCDILIASEQAKFADTHVRMGVVPGWGLSQRLSMLVGASRAKEMSYSARYVDAHTAANWGLVNRVLAADELIPYCLELAKDIQAADRDTLQAVQRLINYSLDHGLSEGIEEEGKISRAHAKKISAAALDERRDTVMDAGRKQH